MLLEQLLPLVFADGTSSKKPRALQAAGAEEGAGGSFVVTDGDAAVREQPIG